MPQKKSYYSVKHKVPSNPSPTPSQRHSEKNFQVVAVPQPCTFCRAFGADFQCSVCGSLYCNVDCQLNDWQHHRINSCIPRLVKSTPVYVGPEFWAQRGNSPNPSGLQDFAPASPGTTNVLNAPLQSTLPTKPTNPKQAAWPSSQTHVAKPPFKANVQAKNVPSSLSKFIPTQAIATQPANKPVQPLKPIPFAGANFSVPPPSLGVPLQMNDSKRCESVPSSQLQSPGKRMGAINNSILSAIVPHSDPKVTSSIASRTTTTTTTTTKVIRSQQFILPAPFPAAGRKVRISHVDEDRLFIYGVGLEPNGLPNQYLQLMKKTLDAAKKMEKFLHNPPAKHEILFAPLDGEYYRAVVISHDKMNITVIFPDLGNKATMSWRETKEIVDPNVKYAPCFTFEVYIENVSKFTPPMYDFLRTMVENEEFEILKVADLPASHIKEVDLKHVQQLYRLSYKLHALSVVIEPEEPKRTNGNSTEETAEASVRVAASEKSHPEEQAANEPTTQTNLNESSGPALLPETSEVDDAIFRSRTITREEIECDGTTTATLGLVVSALRAATSTPVLANMSEEEAHRTAKSTPTRRLSAATYNPVLLDELKDASLPEGASVSLYVVSASDLEGSNTISVVHKSDMMHFEAMKRECNRYAMADPQPYQPKQWGEVCVIKHENSWWRALCLGVASDNYLLLDLKQSCTIKEKADLRQYPAQMTRQLYVHDCIADNPRMLKLAASMYKNENKSLVGSWLTASVSKVNDVFHANIVDLGFD